MREALRSRPIRRFAAAHFLLEVQFWFPVYLIFLLDLGFSLAVAVLADGAFRLVSAVCEVPMGLLADWLGRRRTYLLLTGLTVVTFGAITQIQSVGALFAAWIVWGVLWALGSGASATYLYELIEREGPAVDAARVFGLVRALGHVAVLLSLLSAGYLYDVRPTAPFAVTAALAAVAFLLARTLPDTSAVGARTSFGSVLHEARSAAADTRIRLVVALGAVLLLLGWSPRILFQPLALELGYSAQRTGWMYAAFAAAAVLAGIVAAQVRAEHRRGALSGAFALVLVSVAVTSQLAWLGPFLLLPLLGFGYAVGITVLEVVTNEVSSPRVRTTVFSVVSLVGGLGIAVARPALGIASDVYSVPVAFGLWAAVGGALLVLALVLLRRLEAAIAAAAGAGAAQPSRL
jgi:MFS family permease